MEKNNILNLYEKMVLIRRFEEKSGQLYGMGKICGFCHLYIGQEAVATGVHYCLKPGDTVITSYRDHGTMLAQDSDPNLVMAELFGKRAGCSKGKGGSMHMFDTPKGFYGGHGIVGAQVPIGTGLGFAHKYRENNSVSVVYLGDGAVNQGQVYESFNMASLWNLPVVYIIENNEYAMGTSVARAAANHNLLYSRGEPFDIPGCQADGMDVLKVIECAKTNIEHTRSGNGPSLIEFKTYRYRGHSVSDPATYRTKDEVEEYKKHHDPIAKLREHILTNQISTEEELKTIEVRAKQRASDSAEFADRGEFPSDRELFTDVYSRPSA